MYKRGFKIEPEFVIYFLFRPISRLKSLRILASKNRMDSIVFLLEADLSNVYNLVSVLSTNISNILNFNGLKET